MNSSKQGTKQMIQVTKRAATYRNACKRMHKQSVKLGSGAFANVFLKQADYPSAVKLARFDQECPSKDGYYNYLEAIISSDNPHLPKVMGAVLCKPRECNPYVKVELEPLVSIHELELDELVHILTTSFGMSADCLEYVTFGYLVDELVTKFARGCRDCYHDTYCWSAELRDVAVIINNLMYAGFTLDIHEGNIMFRRTPYGVQLVITDPLSFCRSSNNRTFTV